MTTLLKELITILEFAPDDKYDHNGVKAPTGGGGQKPPKPPRKKHHERPDGDRPSDNGDPRSKIQIWLDWDVVIIADASDEHPMGTGGGLFGTTANHVHANADKDDRVHGKKKSDDERIDAYFDVAKMEFRSPNKLWLVIGPKGPDYHINRDTPVGFNLLKPNHDLQFQGTSSFPSNVILEDFTKMPNVNWLSFGRAEILSWKGAEKLSNVKNFDFEPTDYQKPVGLHNILLFPNVNEIRHALREDEIASKPEKMQNFYRALAIVVKHIESGDRNVAKCRQAIIDAGLENYAK